MTREEAIEILWRYDVDFEPHPPEEVMHAIDMAIEALSADAVEVVRCKDCKHWLQHTQFGYDEENEVYDDYCEIFTPEDDFYAIPTNENDFCSYGERRADEVDDRLLDDM